MILVGSRQRSRGSVAMCQRTTFLSFLFRKKIVFPLIPQMMKNLIT